jgi:hypothetical protein
LPIDQRAIDAVAQDYIQKYGVQGIVEMVWDETGNKYKYLNLDGAWIWYE